MSLLWLTMWLTCFWGRFSMLKCFWFFCRARRIGPVVVWTSTAFHSSRIVFLRHLPRFLPFWSIGSLWILWLWNYDSRWWTAASKRLDKNSVNISLPSLNLLCNINFSNLWKCFKKQYKSFPHKSDNKHSFLMVQSWKKF